MTTQEIQQRQDQFKVWQAIYNNTEVETNHREYALRQMVDLNNEIRTAGGKMLCIDA